jgi:hypothetical protein
MQKKPRELKARKGNRFRDEILLGKLERVKKVR